MTSGSAGTRETRRLWSLWEIMKPFGAVAFMQVQSFTVWYRVFKEDAYSRLALALGKFIHRERGVFKTIRGIVTEDDRTGFDDVYRHLEELCEYHQLGESLATTKKMRELLKTPGSKYEELYDLGIELSGRLEDEMKECIFLSLTLEETTYYKEPRKGWEEVVDRFPDTVGDIEEARKCFALSRYAAAVFHSVQVVELGLLSLGTIIGVNDPHSGWSAVTGTLGKILATKYNQRTPFQQKHSQFFEQIHGTLEALKNAWRNKVSHAQGKLTLLTADFSEAVAEEILFATRGFMRRLATEMPEP